MRRYTATLILFGLAISLGAYIAWVDRKAPSTKELSEKEKRIVAELDREAVKTVLLERGGETVEIRREGEEWRIAKPVDFPADSAAIESLISAVEFLARQRSIADAKPAEYGLDKPRASVTLSGGKPVRLQVGGDDATGRSVYVSGEPGGPVWVVERNFLDALTKPLSDMRDRRLVRLERAALKTLTLVQAGTRTTIERDGETWRLASEGGSLASTERVTTLLGKIEDTKASRIVAEGLADLAKYGLDPAVRSVEIDAGGVESLLLGNACGETSGEVYAARKGKASAVFCVKQDDADGWFADPAQLRETRLMPLDANALDRIVIEAGGKKLALERKAEKWSLVDPTGEPADGDVVTKWAADLAAFRSTESVPLDAPRQGLSAPARITVEGGGRTVKLAFGKTEGGTVFVRRDEEPTALKVHVEVAAQISTSSLTFRARRVLDFSRYDVKHLIGRSGGVEEEARKLDAGGWKLERPSKLAADDAVIDEVTGVLSELRAEKFVPAEQANGLAQPFRVLVATVEPPAGADEHRDENEDEDGEDGGPPKPKGKQVVTLQLGAPLPDGTCFGRLDTKGPTFVLADKACKSLRSPLVVRKLFELDESKLVGFSLRRAAEEVVLEKRGPDWHRAGGGRIDSARIEDLLGLIRNARAADALGYGTGSITSPRLSLAVRIDGQPEQRIDIGGAAGDGLGARIAGRDVAYAVDQGLAEALEQLGF